jgi:hypothetical protein
MRVALLQRIVTLITILINVVISPNVAALM